MTNLTKRILSSIFFVILIIGPLFLSAKIAYTCFAVLGAFTLREVIVMVKHTGSNVNVGVAYVWYAALVFLFYQIGFGYEQGLSAILSALLSIFLLSFLTEIFRLNRKPFESVAGTLVAPLFVSMSFLGLVYYLGYRSDLPQPWIVISVFVLVWVNDSAAYLFGRKIGKRKLYERLSPNKTIEGSVAGLVFALIAGGVLSTIEGMPDASYMVGFALVCIVCGSLGDLFESRLKRAAQVKDSGVFLPGHGGFFDRFDAMMLAIPGSILFFELALPKP